MAYASNPRGGAAAALVHRADPPRADCRCGDQHDRRGRLRQGELCPHRRTGPLVQHRAAMAALTEIFLHGGVQYGPAEEHAATSPLEQILRAGQASGVFRAFDPTIMAALVQRSVDGFPLLLASRPDLDPGAYAAEVTTAFDLATRASA